MQDQLEAKWKVNLDKANSAERCEARTRKHYPCQAPAMSNGRCRMHGGTSLSGKNHPNYKHGEHMKERLASEKNTD